MKTVVNPQDSLRRKLYEAMFLIDSAEAASDWDGINATIRTILEKAEAEIVSTRKWSECKLAYEIDHKTRGTYILVYFRADGGKIAQIERDVRLCERIMRVLILNAEAMGQEGIEQEENEVGEKDTPVVQPENHSQKIAQEAAQKAEAKQTVETEQTVEAEQAVSEKQPQEAEESEQE